MERAARNDISVLVVDDDVCLRAILGEILEQEGYIVSLASNGFSGLRLAAEQHPRIVLLDLALPELSGFEVLRELRSNPRTHDIAVVIVSGNAERLATEGQLDLVDAVIHKPFTIESLLDIVHQVAESGVSRPATHLAEVPPVVVATPVASTHHTQANRAWRSAVRHTRGRHI